MPLLNEQSDDIALHSDAKLRSETYEDKKTFFVRDEQIFPFCSFFDQFFAYRF